MKPRWLSLLIVFNLIFLSTFTLFQNETTNAEDINNKENIYLNYQFNKPFYSTVKIFNDEFARLQLEELPLSGNEGEPRIPVKPLRILLPESTTVEKITVETSEASLLEITDLNSIELGGKTHSLNQQDLNLQDKSIIPLFDENQLYPPYQYENLGIQYFRGYAILHINLYPVQYLGKTNTLYYYNEISVVVGIKERLSNPLF